MDWISHWRGGGGIFFFFLRGREKNVWAFQIKAAQEPTLAHKVCTKFDVMNHDGVLISEGCRSAKSFAITKTL